jgi:hypothetical protein
VNRETSYTCAAVKRVQLIGKLVALLLLAGVALPAMASKSVSIEQFEQMLFGDQGKSDEKVAERIADLVLTERVSPVRLARWEKMFPGARTREVLLRLADEAAFLNPPMTDVLRDPAPDDETQSRMLALALDFAKTSAKQLPNFTVSLITTHFEDASMQEAANSPGSLSVGSVVRAIRSPGSVLGRGEAKPMHSTGTTTETVTYRDGRQEDAGAQAGTDKKDQISTRGMTMSGEFGSIEEIIVGDALRGQVEWSHWEQGATDPVAVFHYSVPEDRSNYKVNVPNGDKTIGIYPAYHGEIALDPATGAILHLNVMAEMPPPYDLLQNNTALEYAPIGIGDRSCNCPVHGVAFSKMPVAAKEAQENSTVTLQTQMNDVTFTDYRLLLAGAPTPGDVNGKSEVVPASAGPRN